MNAKSPIEREPRCSICGKATVEAYKPFCSPRCADVDLARWLGGGYAIAGGSADEDEDGAMPIVPVVDEDEDEI